MKQTKKISALIRTSSQGESNRVDQEPDTARLFHPVAATDDISAEEQYLYSVCSYRAATLAKSSGRHRGRGRSNKRRRRRIQKGKGEEKKSPEPQSAPAEEAILRDHRQIFNLPGCADGSRQRAARSSPFGASGTQLSDIRCEGAVRT